MTKLNKPSKNLIMQKLNISSTNVLETPEDYCGTSYAAKLLGLSIGTIQSLVEKNELQAWRTKGGHRRISLDSINIFLRKNNIAISPHKSRNNRLRILIVDDDIITRQILGGYCENFDPPIDCTLMASGMEALIDISSINPDLLITDLDMPGIDGFELLRTLRQNSQFDHMRIIVLSALSESEIQNRGTLPKDSIYIPKPANSNWFNGFITGITLWRTEND